MVIVYASDETRLYNFCSYNPYHSTSSITDNRIVNDRVDLREDLSSDQGGTGSASGSSVSNSAFRGMYTPTQL